LPKQLKPIRVQLTSDLFPIVEAERRMQIPSKFVSLTGVTSSTEKFPTDKKKKAAFSHRYMNRRAPGREIEIWGRNLFALKPYPYEGDHLCYINLFLS
jgi:hypothetical protein